MEIQRMKKTFNGLYLCRGLFSIGIVLFHLDVVLGCNPDVIDFISRNGGSIGNFFFFLTSGFLVNYYNKERVVNKRISLVEFVKNKYKKLYPHYIVTNVLSIIMMITLGGGWDMVEKKRVFFSIFMIEPSPFNTPTWFISVLLLCYIVWYILVDRLKGRKDISIYMIVLLKLIFYFCDIESNVVQRTLTGILYFSVGVLASEIYEMYLRNKNSEEMPTVGRINWMYKLGNVSMLIFFWHAPVLDLYATLFGESGYGLNMLFIGYWVSLIIVIYIVNIVSLIIKKMMCVR